MISITKIVKLQDGTWSIEDSSERFETREEALRRLVTMKTKKVSQKYTEGRKFYSQKADMFFRSNWEIELAEMLIDLGVKFEYEPKRFYYRAERESYLPDFYLPQYNCWVEVKGYMDKRSLKRVKLFKKYEKVPFFLYEREERELALKNPEILLTFIQIAMEENKR